jgi:hypothetical protein
MDTRMKETTHERNHARGVPRVVSFHGVICRFSLSREFLAICCDQHISTSIVTAFPPPRQSEQMPRLPPVRFN